MTSGIRFHLALCEEKLGQLVPALDDYSAAQVAAQRENNRDVLDQVAAPLAALKARVPTLTLNMPPSLVGAAGVELLVDGKSVPLPVSGARPCRSRWGRIPSWPARRGGLRTSRRSPRPRGRRWQSTFTSRRSHRRRSPSRRRLRRHPAPGGRISDCSVFHGCRSGSRAFSRARHRRHGRRRRAGRGRRWRLRRRRERPVKRRGAVCDEGLGVVLRGQVGGPDVGCRRVDRLDPRGGRWRRCRSFCGPRPAVITMRPPAPAASDASTFGLSLRPGSVSVSGTF